MITAPVVVQHHCAYVQAHAVTPIQAEVAGLLVRLEALQEMVANVACLHRVFFQRLVWHARTHTAGPGSEAGPLPQNDSDETDHEHALHTFLEQHFLQDALMLEVQVQHRALQATRPVVLSRCAMLLGLDRRLLTRSRRHLSCCATGTARSGALCILHLMRSP